LKAKLAQRAAVAEARAAREASQEAAKAAEREEARATATAVRKAEEAVKYDPAVVAQVTELRVRTQIENENRKARTEQEVRAIYAIAIKLQLEGKLKGVTSLTPVGGMQ
jgi:hypothetical protein